MKQGILKTALVAALLATGSVANAQTIYGLTNSNQMFSMSNANNPSNINGPYNVTGVTSGQSLIAIDSRPDNGGLYALGYNSTSGEAQLYSLSNNNNGTGTGNSGDGNGNGYTATAIGSATTGIDLGNSSSGNNSGYNNSNSTGFDFISTMANEIRIIGSNGNSYMMNADNGTFTNTNSNSGSGNGNTYGSGSSLFSGTTANIGATAYSNSYYGSDAANEYGYDLNTNSIVMFQSANNSNNYNYTPNSVNFMGLSGLVLSSGSSVGMDSWYNTSNHTNTLYLSATSVLNSGSHLYSMNDNNGSGGSNGLLTDMGAMGNGNLNVRDITASNNSNGNGGGAMEGNTMAALTLNLRNLIFFGSDNPGNINSMHQITGMTSGQRMLAIDYGNDLQLYGLGYNSNNQTYQLYIINEATGQATAVNQNPQSMNLGNDNDNSNTTSGNSGSGNNVNAAFSFISSSSNRIRVIGNNGQTNDQLDATTGLIAETDNAIQYGSGDGNNGQVANIGSLASTNDYNGSDNSDMYGIDFNNGYLVQFTDNSNGNGNGNNGSGDDGSDGNIYSMLNLSIMLNLSSLSGNNNGNNGDDNGYLAIAYNAATNTNNAYYATNYYGNNDNGADNYSNFGSTTLDATGDAVSTGTIGSGTPVKSMSAKKTYNPTAVSTVVGNAMSNLTVYPNPVTSAARIMLPQASYGKVYVDVLDMNGRVNRSYEFPAGSYQLDMDMNTLPIGLYSVRVSGKGMNEQNLKVIKQ